MGAVDLAVKTCTKCGETKPLSEFYRRRASRDGRATQCRTCVQTTVLVNRAAERERMGDEYWKAHQAEIVRRHRAKGRDARSRESRQAYNSALHELRRRHPAEFQAILLLERHDRGLS
jgi:hypothetical protein